MKTVTAFNVNSGGWTPYTVQSPECKKIVVCEVNQAGTVDYYISATGSDGDQRARPAGKEFPYESEKWLHRGEVPFYIKTATGSVNFDAEETRD